MKRNSLTEDFVTTIERKILSGEWAIGAHLPPLRELAESMNVSRSVVNAGIVELTKIGYLKIVPRKWTEVADWPHEGTLSVLDGLAREGLLAEKSLDSVLDARRLIECECVQLACIHATAEQLQELQAHILKERQAVSLEERVQNDLQFHHMLSIMSGNMVYPLIIKSFERIAEEFVTLFYQNTDVFEVAVSLHADICRYLAKHNAPKARAAMEQLLLHGEQKIHQI